MNSEREAELAAAEIAAARRELRERQAQHAPIGLMAGREVGLGQR